MVETQNVLRMVGKGVAVVVALLLVSALVIGGLVAGGVIELKQPTVESVDTQWGAVSEGSTGIQTNVVVNNPNPIGVPGVLDLSYEAKMNSVILAEGAKQGVGLSTGDNEIEMATQMENTKIAKWWVTHINNDESSTMKITAQVDGPMGVSETIPVRNSKFETDLLDNLAGGGERTISMGGDDFLVLQDQTAEWGDATSDETPLSFTATVKNVHDHAVSLDGLGYNVQMNSVTVGQGSQTEGVTVEPGETETIEVTAVLDTPKMADWWATHVENNETTQLSVSMFGFVEEDGERKRLPMEFFEKDLRLETAILAGGGTSTEPIESDEGPNTDDFGAPTVNAIDRQWGDVTDDVTEVDTSISIDNPNSDEFSTLLSVQMGQTVTINDVVVSDGSTQIDGFQQGTNSIDYTAELDNSKVPEWWARHVNKGEQSTIEMNPQATADVAFTKFDVPIEGSTQTMETSMLEGLTQSETEELKSDGETVAVISQTSAEWGTATAERSPFTVSVTLENERDFAITVKNLEYSITFNDVTTGEGVAPESYTLAPGEKRTITFSMEIDSQKMDEWWVSHIKNGEETTVNVDASVEVETFGSTDTIPLSSLTQEQTISTDILGNDEE